MKKQNEDLIFTDNKNQTVNNNPAILGILEGCCADFIDATRNGRVYDESVWDKVFQEDSIVNELIENGGIPGEMDHPTGGRTDFDSSRLAILMTEKPVKKDGKLWARFNILDTPLGKIAYTLAKAGFKLGISSRGTGDTFQDVDGREHVDEESYDFRCFDLVIIPSVKDARLNLITESLNKRFNYKKALKESLSSASKEDRKIMEETLDNLNIQLEDYKVVEKDEDGNTIDTYTRKKKSEADKLKKDLEKVVNETTSEFKKEVNIDLDDIEEHGSENNQSNENDNDNVSTEQENVVNDKNDLVDGLQSALQDKLVLQEENRGLQEKLSVCYAKEAKFESTLESYKQAVRSLSSENKQIDSLRQKVSSLTEQLDASTKSANKFKKQVSQLKESLNQQETTSNSLNENLSKKTDIIKRLKSDNAQLTESLNKSNKKYNNDISQLNEELADYKKDSQIKSQRYDEKLAHANKLVESYRQTAQKAVNRYIGLQAKMLGVGPNEIKNRLDENYSFEDIDEVCESLKAYKLNIESLPYNISTNKNQSNLRMNIQESYNPSRPKSINDDDAVDSMLLEMVRI